MVVTVIEGCAIATVDDTRRVLADGHASASFTLAAGSTTSTATTTSTGST